MRMMMKKRRKEGLSKSKGNKSTLCLAQDQDPISIKRELSAPSRFRQSDSILARRLFLGAVVPARQGHPATVLSALQLPACLCLLCLPIVCLSLHCIALPSSHSISLCSLYPTLDESAITSYFISGFFSRLPGASRTTPSLQAVHVLRVCVCTSDGMCMLCVIVFRSCEINLCLVDFGPLRLGSHNGSGRTKKIIEAVKIMLVAKNIDPLSIDRQGWFSHIITQ